MSRFRNDVAYDLGDVDRQAPAMPRPVGAPVASVPPVSLLASLRSACRSLSLFVPGAGQLVQGQIAPGLLFLTSTGFAASLGWAILNTLDRLAPTVNVLGFSPAAPIWTLVVLYAAAAVLHVASVIHVAVEPEYDRHPMLTSCASALLPGWGQFLNGDRLRAATFLGALWIAGAAWIVGTPWALELIRSQGLFLPHAARVFGSEVLRITLPAVVWSLAVYEMQPRRRSTGGTERRYRFSPT